MKNYSIILLFCVSFIIACEPQKNGKIKIPINKEVFQAKGISGAMIDLEEPLPINWVTGIPDSILKPRLYESITNRLQFATNGLALGLIDSVQYEKEIERWGEVYLESNRPASLAFIRSDILFVVGNDAKQNIIVGLDPSLDYDFSDGHFWIAGKDGEFNDIPTDSIPTVPLNGQFWNDSQLMERTQLVKLDFKEFPGFGMFATVGKVFIPRFTISIDSQSALFELDSDLFWSFRNAHLNLEHINTVSNQRGGRFQMRDTILINEHKLVFTDIDPMGSWIEYEDLGIDSNFVFPGTGGIAPNIVAQTVKGDGFSLEDYRGRYVFLDFWGTWCKPCVESIPDLKEAYDTYGNRVEFVGLALNNTDKIVEFTQAEGMNWTQISIEGEFERIANHYKVIGYPTYFLIDPNGRIVAKDGKIEASRLSEYLGQILN